MNMNKKLKFEDLEEIINKYTTKESKISIEIKDFNGNIIIEHNPNIKVNSASCIKVAIMIAVLKKVQINELELDRLIDFRNLDLDDEDGIYNEIERKATVLELLTFMIINSDNLATDVLIELFGFQYYNDFFKKNGLLNTELNRFMGIYDSGKENYTSNEDMYHLYKQLYQEKILNKELCDIAKNILHKQRLKDASQRYIYEDIEVYHKTGGLDSLNLRNDCGYFVLNYKAYYFGFFMEQMTSKEDASILIGNLFKLIYENMMHLSKQTILA